MKCVTDTGPLLWLERIGYGNELHKIYSTVWVPPAVESLELSQNWRDTASIWPRVQVYRFHDDKDERRFNRLVRRWMKKHDYPENERADVETFILHKYFADSEVALYANKDAEAKFGKRGIQKEPECQRS